MAEVFDVDDRGGLVFLRPADLLTFTVRYSGFKLDQPARPRKLVRTAPLAFLAFELPPQAIVEEEQPADGAQAQARAAGPTRLVFQPRAEVTELVLGVESLLDWTRFDLAVRQSARTGAPDAATETAIEAPYGLFLSPTKPESWDHLRVPGSRRGTIDLWQTRLRALEGGSLPRLRLLHWRSQDVPGLPPLLDVPTRQAITELTSAALTPVPPREQDLIELEHLYLSSLGASMDAHAFWPSPPPGYTLTGFRHHSAFAREHYIKRITRGLLWPYGHRAAYVEVAERVFDPAGAAAPLKRKQWIVVKQPRKTYDVLKLPYASVELLTATTSLIVPDTGLAEHDAFWPVLQDQPNVDFPFRVRAVDRSGNASEVTQPLAFVSDDLILANTSAKVERVKARIRPGHPVFGEAAPPRTQVALSGQRVAFAPERVPGDATLEVAHLLLDSAVGTVEQPFLPIMSQAGVIHSAVKQIMQGVADVADPSLLVEYPKNYLDQTLKNAASMFLQRVDGAAASVLDFAAHADKSGGLVAPRLDFTGFSQTIGVLSGAVDSLSAGRFDPLQFLGADSKLLGILPLKDLLGTIEDFTGVLGAIPQLKTLYQDATRLESGFDWDTTGLKSFGPFVARPGCKLTIKVRVKAELAPAGLPHVTVTVDGKLEKFAIDLYAIVVDFSSVTFHNQTGERADFNPTVSGVSFGNGLEFLNEFKKFLSSSNLPGPFVDLLPTGVEAGFRLALPSIGFGLFSIQNLSLTSGLELHFSGDSPFQLHFEFGTAYYPFLVSVGIFGGGGHFGMRLDPKGLRMLEASLEFGGCVALDLGVASGGVYIMAGFYYRLEDGQSKFSAFVRAGGLLDVLGLITISVEFYLALSLETRPDALYLSGDASLTVTVEVLFFSAEVRLSIHREFKGPSLGAQHLHAGMLAAEHGPDEEAEWQTYWDAFAA